MKINNFFTNSIDENFLQTAFKIASSDFKSIESNNSNASGGSVVSAEVPSNWSQISVDILAQNYFCKKEIPAITKKINEDNIPEWLQRSEEDAEQLSKLAPEQRYIKENSAKQVFHRIAGALTYWGYKSKYFHSEEDALVFFKEIQYILCHQIASPNSQHWTHTGLNWAYGLKDERGEYYYFDEDLKNVIKSKDFSRYQTNSYFVQSVEDSLTGENGIMDLIRKEAQIFKYGSGTGTNFSNIRSKGEKLLRGGTSTGLMSFVRVADTSAGAIKHGGTKRASKMVVLNINHPEIEDLITWKVNEEQKVVSLVTGSLITHKSLQNILASCENYKDKDTMFDVDINLQLRNSITIAKGLMIPEKYIHRTILLAKQDIYTLDFNVFSTGWDSESYYTVSGQNSNVALNIPNQFMEKMLNDEDWELINVFDKSINKNISSKGLWDKITYASWSCADPCINFQSTINDWNTCPNGGEIQATNPYGEFLFLNDTSCSLASLNILKFRDDDGNINLEAYHHVIKLLTIMLDITITMGHFPSQSIANLSYKYRPLGLGYTNIGAFLMSTGVSYDSDEGRDTVAAITAIMTGVAYEVSSELAKNKGAFSEFEVNKDAMLRVISNHTKALYNNKKSGYEKLSIDPVGISTITNKNEYLVNFAKKAWGNALELGNKYGYRNAQVSCISPTSNISLLMDCATTGIDPDFAIVKYKNVGGGGYFKMINPSVVLGLQTLGYSSKEIKDIENYAIGYKTLQGSPKINHEKLKSKGFTEKEIGKIEDSLNNIFNIEFAFNQYILGEEFCKNVLKIDLEKLKNPNFSLLKTIGFSQEDINEANAYVTGTMTVEGAPHLKEEHVSVFDCSTRCGGIGIRYLSYESHIAMIASVQSFISGAVAKTITMPEHSTIKDFSKAYLMAWRMGVKIISLYRDGSKLSQPLKHSILSKDDLYKNVLDNLFNKNDLNNSSDNINKENPTENNYNKICKLSKHLGKNNKKIPSNHRKGYTQKSSIGDVEIYLHTNEYEDGNLAEVFIDMPKENDVLSNMTNCFAMAMSIGLQYGIPLEEFVNIFSDINFYPSGQVNNNNNIKNTTSIVDYIVKDLAFNYLN